ncbi:hypothetical protein MANES_12G089522v8 [Manihot esculenta]|uniref:Uncharacterized protein n=1 Tax=Manihot esculenta TaxID=3983 RepID=A0ACB7GSM1_MANES|nr:hypothetical protein MANES_12G089522v8 [Manihot esculenta]
MKIKSVNSREKKKEGSSCRVKYSSYQLPNIPLYMPLTGFTPSHSQAFHYFLSISLNFSRFPRNHLTIFSGFFCFLSDFHLSKSMKKSGFFAASVAAASAISVTPSSSSTSSFSCNSNMPLSREEASSKKEHERSASTDKFAPRFDGLRFIETLVTAHR